jgi:predicted nucleic acid-binding protein
MATASRSTAANVVVDASVAVKWVVAENDAEAALRLLDGRRDLFAPAHWLAEAANALWAACRRGELSEQQAHARVIALTEAPVAVVPLAQLAAAAMTIALRLGLTLYDALYLAVAEQQDATLVTADRRLFDAARRDKDLRARVRWIANP